MLTLLTAHAGSNVPLCSFGYCVDLSPVPRRPRHLAQLNTWVLVWLDGLFSLISKKLDNSHYKPVKRNAPGTETGRESYLSLDRFRVRTIKFTPYPKEQSGIFMLTYLNYWHALGRAICGSLRSPLASLALARFARSARSLCMCLNLIVIVVGCYPPFEVFS